MQAETDTSAEAVERLARDCDDHAQWLRDRTPEGGTAGLAEVYDRIGATLRALHTRAQQAEAERDALIADNAMLVQGLTDANNACVAAETERDAARAAHRENARILGLLFNELQGRVDAGKVIAIGRCAARARAALGGAA